MVTREAERFSHFEWLATNWAEIITALGGDPVAGGAQFSNSLIDAHGDKYYGYKKKWAEHGIPFHHGVALALMTHTPIFSDQVRRTPSGWVVPGDWVTSNYHRFRARLSAIPDLCG